MRLENEVAIVTGSTRGLGRAIAKRYAAEGAKVVVSGRSVDVGERVVSQIAEAGGEAIFVRADVTVVEDVQNLVDAAVSSFGKLTIMVNNACPTELVYDMSGNARADGTLRDITSEGWDSVILGTLTQSFYCCKYAAPALGDAGGGSIINVSSYMGYRGAAGLIGYCSGKSALYGLTKSVAVEEAPHGTRCNCIVVGTLPMTEREDGGPDRSGLIEGEFGKVFLRLPLLGFGDGEDMANLTLFLGSRESKYLTGLIIPIDGGWSAKSFIESFDLGHEEVLAEAGATA